MATRRRRRLLLREAASLPAWRVALSVRYLHARVHSTGRSSWVVTPSAVRSRLGRPRNSGSSPAAPDLTSSSLSSLATRGCDRPLLQASKRRRPRRRPISRAQRRVCAAQLAVASPVSSPWPDSLLNGPPCCLPSCASYRRVLAIHLDRMKCRN